MLDAVPCNSSAECYAVTSSPKALNGSTLLTKNADGVWIRDDGFKLMKQNPFNNQYLNVSDNIALNAIGYSFSHFKYYSLKTIKYTAQTENNPTHWENSPFGSFATHDGNRVFTGTQDLTVGGDYERGTFKTSYPAPFGGTVYDYELIIYTFVY